MTNRDNQTSSRNDRQRNQAIATGIGLGLALGAAIGLLLDNLPAGIAIGMGIGAAFGAAYYGKQEQANRESFPDDSP